MLPTSGANPQSLQSLSFIIYNNTTHNAILNAYGTGTGDVVTVKIPPQDEVHFLLTANHTYKYHFRLFRKGVYSLEEYSNDVEYVNSSSAMVVLLLS